MSAYFAAREERLRGLAWEENSSCALVHVSSVLMKRLSKSTWRRLHALSPLLVWCAVLHGALASDVVMVLLACACVGRVLARDVLADRDFPSYHRVMMDGIAICHRSWQAGRRVVAADPALAIGKARLFHAFLASCRSGAETALLRGYA